MRQSIHNREDPYRAVFTDDPGSRQHRLARHRRRLCVAVVPPPSGGEGGRLTRSGASIDTTRLGDVLDRPDWKGARIAVIGDVHGNAHAFRAALQDIEKSGVERIVNQGDLLTYGCAPRECLELLDDMVDRFDTVQLSGNHDFFYFGGQQGDEQIFSTKQPFVVESVRWTLDRMEDIDFAVRYRWHDAVCVGDLLVTHANPFEHGDWRYVGRSDDERAAALDVARRGIRVLCVGHTHRARAVSVQGGLVLPMRVGAKIDFRGEGIWLLNAGSVGQPRGVGST